MSSRPTTPAHRGSRVAEAVQIAPYLTHIVRHHGQLTLIPPENEGRIRKEKRTRITRNRSKSHSNLSLPDVSQSSTNRSRALTNRPSSASLTVGRPGLNGSLRSHSENNVAIANHGILSRSNDNLSPNTAETIPDFPPSSFEEAATILRATTTGGETPRPPIEGPPGSLEGHGALVGSGSSRTRMENPLTFDVDITSESESTSSSLFIVEAPSEENARAQQWEEDRMAGVFSLEERVRRELERRRRQGSLSPPAEGIFTTSHLKGKEVLRNGSEGGHVQRTSRKGKERAALEDCCPGPASSLPTHDWVSVDVSRPSGSLNRSSPSRTTTSAAAINPSGCVPTQSRHKDASPHVLEVSPDILSSPFIANEAALYSSLSHLHADPDLEPHLPSSSSTTLNALTPARGPNFNDDQHDSHPHSPSTLSGYTSRQLPDASTGNIIPNPSLHLTDSQSNSDLQLHDKDDYASCISRPGTSSKSTETIPVSLTQIDCAHSHPASHTTTSSPNDQLSSLDEGPIDTRDLSRLTAHPPSPSPLGSSANANQPSGAIERSDVAVPIRSAAPKSLSLSLTNRPLPCPPPSLLRPKRQPPMPPSKLPADVGGFAETSQPLKPPENSPLGSSSRPRRIPPPPPPRRPRIILDPPVTRDRSVDSSIKSVSAIDIVPVILSPQQTRTGSAGTLELLPKSKSSYERSYASELTVSVPGVSSSDDMRAMESQSSICPPDVQALVSIEDNAQHETLDASGSVLPASVNGRAGTLLSTEILTGATDVEAMHDAGPASQPHSPEALTTTVGHSTSRIPRTDAPLEPSEQYPPIVSEITDLGILLNLLDDETRTVDGSAYNDLLALGDFLGPAQALAMTEGGSTSTAVDDLGNVFVGKVAVDRRRVTKDGRTKLKLSLFGVVVDKCTICLTQFKEGSWSCLLPCQHAFHEKCCRSWLLRSISCPLCRSAVT